jgi:hypothetical protein
LQVRGFPHYSFSDRPRVLGGQSAAGRQSARGRGPFSELLDRSGVFRLEATFVLRTVAPCLSVSPPLLSRIVRGSQADCPVCTQILAKVVRFLCFFSTASTCASRNRS